MFKFAEIEKEEHEKKVLRDCRALAAKKHLAGLDVTLDLKYRLPQGDYAILADCGDYAGRAGVHSWFRFLPRQSYCRRSKALLPQQTW